MYNGDYEYKYYLNEDENEIYRVHIEEDDCPFNPREEYDGYACKIYVENRSYNLSDKLNISSIEEAKRMIVRDANITVDQMIDYIKSGKSDYELKYDEESEEWELWGSFDTIFNHVEYGVYESKSDIRWLEDAMVEALDIKDFENISNGELAVEHLIITEAYYNPLLEKDTWRNGDFDGYIWVSKDMLEKAGYGSLEKGKTWEQVLHEDLESELDEYNKYLQGEVYGWIEEKCIDIDDAEFDDAWEEIGSCWGYIMDEDKVLDEEFCDLTDDLESLVKLREAKLEDIHIVIRETKKVDTIIKVTDEQFKAIKSDDKFFTENKDGDRIYNSILKNLKKGDIELCYTATGGYSKDGENLAIVRTETM